MRPRPETPEPRGKGRIIRLVVVEKIMKKKRIIHVQSTSL